MLKLARKEKEGLRISVNSPTVLREVVREPHHRELTREEKLEIAAELFSSPIEEKLLGREELSSLSLRARRAVSVAAFARMMNEGRRYLLVASRPQAIEIGVAFANLSEEAGTHFVHLTDEMAKENGELNGVRLKVEKIRDFFTLEARTSGKH